ncbi:MAG TPA: hypothetical protein VLK65_28210 [Vicinamibacteria bacterium]|nr:hypothetical protein [Vicinamibacteria bacterium]
MSRTDRLATDKDLFMGGTPLKKLVALLASPRVGWLAALVAVLLSLPSIPTRWYLDDVIHRARFLEVGPMADSANMTHRMFDFLSGNPDEILGLKDLGVLPWWADDELKIRFWRPLSSFTHVIDYALWPESGILMHLHSAAWLAGLVLATTMLYRRLIAVPMVAGLAALLYALDDAHAMPVAFLANRNAIVSASLGVLSLWSHDRFRRDQWTPGAIMSPVAFLASLLAGESGIGVAPYLLGYALFLDPRSSTARFRAIAPHAVIGVAWLSFYTGYGYGTSGSGFYLDPVGQPAEWLAELPIRASLLLLGQWFLPPSSLAFAWTELQRLGVAAFGVAVLAIVFCLLRPIFREDKTARFFGFGMGLAVVPITAGFPHDRLLFFVGIGAMALLAMLLVRLFDRSMMGASGRVLGWILVAVHVVIAVPSNLIMSRSVASQEPVYANPARSLPDDRKLEGQRLVIVNQPDAFYGQYTLIVRLFDGRPTPESMLMLAPGITSLVVERLSAWTISVEAESGWLGSPFDLVYRARTRPFPDDYQVQLSGVRIQVMAQTLDGRPKNVRFTFEREIEDDSLKWVLYQDGRYVPFEPPAVGQRTLIEAVDFSLLTPPEP